MFQVNLLRQSRLLNLLRQSLLLGVGWFRHHGGASPASQACR
jgi:hypothetical protein